jgi:predicted Zn finger-like uncharacterized protein
MSLATRCPVCQTVFRVVQDQLKVSEGWVRCGRCAKVFNAFEGLFDLEREFPALRSPTPSQRVLEDLATRNRQPKPPAAWDAAFDNDATREVPQPPPSQTTRQAMAGTVPHVSMQRGPATAAPPPAPVAPQRPITSAAAQAPAIGTTLREPTPLVPRTPREPALPDKDDGATIPPATVIATPRVATRPDVARPPTAPAAPAPAVAPSSSTAPAPVAPPPVAPATAVAPVATPQPALAKAPARTNAEIAIRDEPAPVPGTAGPDTAAQEESFEALFRSDGEMAEPHSDAEGVDIMLDGSDVEPASLDPDDAVDSRLLTFVQQAEQAERWRQPWVRAVMGVAALVLAMLLAAQLLVAQRDAVVAQWPGWRSLVQSLCAPLDCRIEPLRRIDQLGVDSSGLTRIDDGPVYRLVLVLRNRSDMPLLMPSIDLSLTDAAGVLVARRMLSATDLGTARNTIAAGQELPLQALLMSAERALTGYTIEIFYP